jgi:hypothetical protein
MPFAVTALLAFALGWAGNAALGVAIGTGSSTSAQGLITLAVFWLLAATSVFTVAGTALKAGPERVAGELVAAAGNLREGVSRGPGSALGLVGVALGLVAAFALGSRALDLAIGLPLALAWATPAWRLRAGLMQAAWGRVTRRKDPTQRQLSRPTAEAFVFGMVVALAAGAVVVGSPLLLVAAVVAVVGAVLILRRDTALKAAAMLVLSILSLGLGLRIVEAANTRVTVPANKPWVSTGIKLNYGQQLTIDATGQVHFLPDDSDAVAGPDGGPAFYGGCSYLYFCGALMGRVAGGTPFFIGKHFSAPVQTAGPLELGVQDFAFDHNSGSFDATIQVAPAGTVVAGPPALITVNTSGGQGPASTLADNLLAGICAAIGGASGLSFGRKLAEAPDAG